MRLVILRQFERNQFFSVSQTTALRLFSSSEITDDKVKLKNTIDRNEVEFHSKLAKEWWKEGGLMKPLHAMNEIRVPLVRTGLINAGLLNEKDSLTKTNYLEGLSIADIGCGGGILSIALARLGCDLTGIEPSTELVQIATDTASSKHLSEKAKFVSSSIEDYAQENKEKHDAVICSEVIEHVTSKENFLDACLTILKPGGCIFFTTPNRTPLGGLLTIVAAEYLLRILAIGSHQYDKFITPQELENMLNSKGCATQMVCGIMYLPLVNRFLWAPTTSVHYALVARKKISP